METVFQAVYLLLVYGSHLTGLTYKEINIVVYYMVVPMIYLAMFDRIMRRHWLKIGFGVVCLLVVMLADFDRFSNRLFDLSVKFLLLFRGIGWNYTVASVIICVVVPLVAFCALFYFSYWPALKVHFRVKGSSDPNDR